MGTFPYAPENINVKANIYVATVEVKVGITHVITYAKFILLLKMAAASFSSNSWYAWWMDCNSFDSISDLNCNVFYSSGSQLVWLQDAPSPLNDKP